jgi:hypothetical protein
MEETHPAKYYRVEAIKSGLTFAGNRSSRAGKWH